MVGELTLFVCGLLRHWKASITGGLVAALLFVGEHWAGISVPRGAIGFFVCFAIVASAFQLWREERAGRLRALAKLAEAARLPEPIVRMLSDPEYWLLSKVSAYGMRREFHAEGASSVNSIWVGNQPVHHGECSKFYDLVNRMENQGLLRLETSSGGRQIYRLTPEAHESLDAERRRNRPVVRPDFYLADARDRSPIQDFPAGLY